MTERASPTDGNPAPRERLIEIDFFRGAALLIIFWDHLHWFTGMGFPLRYGFSDGASIFVFLSGYVSGLVYDKAYRAGGLPQLFSKAWKRVGTIYFSHVLSFLIILSIAVAIHPASTPGQLRDLAGIYRANPMEMFINTTFLLYLPELFDILPLYVIFIFVLPFVIPLLKWWKFVLAISFLAYCVTQLFPSMEVQTYFPSWSLNPTSWFFLFITAMIISIKHREGVIRIPVRIPYVIAAWCVVVYAFLDLRTVSQLLQDIGVISPQYAFLFPSPFPLIEKPSLQPVSLIHFFCLAYAVYAFSDRLKPWYATKGARAIVLVGQHSLPLFCGGIILVYLLAHLIATFHLGPSSFFAGSFLGCGMTIAGAIVLSEKRKPAGTLAPNTQRSQHSRKTAEALSQTH